MSFDVELRAAEALELHEFLDEKGIPRLSKEENGNEYTLPLIDRVSLLVLTSQPSAD